MPHLSDYVVNHWPYVLLLAVTLVMLAVYEFRHATREHGAISTAQAVQLLNGGALAIDLRSREDYAAGHIASARHVPGSAIAEGASGLMKWKDKPLIAYCENGNLGGSAVRELGRLGFTQAYNLRGGIAAWRQDNLPLTRN
jgi:rhodanese-related sulfurtransferase